MVENAPAIRSALPDRGSAREAISLLEHVGYEVSVRAKATEGVVPAFPTQ